MASIVVLLSCAINGVLIAVAKTPINKHLIVFIIPRFYGCSLSLYTDIDVEKLQMFYLFININISYRNITLYRKQSRLKNN